MPADFGTKLRTARERKGVSVRQIANQTKISVAALEALERNDISRLPGGIFSRAFVRSYAVEVGLDPEATIQEFIAQFPHDSVTAGHPTSEHIEDFESVESDRRMASTVLWILAMSLALAGGVLYFTMRNRMAPAATALPHARTPPPADPPAVAQPVQPPPAPAEAPAPALVPASRSVSEPATPAPPPAAVAEAPADLLTIGLSARRPVWVSATVDGQKTIERLLQAGEQQTVEVRREMVLTAGDASALNLTLNGAAARGLGQTGEVVTRRLTLANFRDYLQVR